MSSILGPDGGIVHTAKKVSDPKKPITDMRVVMTAKMMVHPQTKEMVMVPMQDFQYQREGSTEWFSMPIVEAEKHEFNPEEKPNEN